VWRGRPRPRGMVSEPGQNRSKTERAGAPATTRTGAIGKPFVVAGAFFFIGTLAGLSIHSY